MKYDSRAIAIALIVAAIVLHLGVVSPMMDSLVKKRAELTRAEELLARTCLAITRAPDTRDCVARLEATNAAARAMLITPLLNSYAMRAKSLLAVPAYESGLGSIEYDDGGYRALPIPPERMPTRRTGRHAVVVRTRADYAAIASFVLRVERDLPLASVQAITVAPGSEDQSDVQKADIVLEWPCEGEVIR